MHSNARILTMALLVACAPLFACEEKKPEQNSADGSESPSGKGVPSATPSAEKADEGAATPSAPGNKAEDGGGRGVACLAGKWHYDFADDALETMMANLPKAKVTKEEGELICEVTLSGGSGKLTCSSSGGKPVLVEVSADQGGMPLSIGMKISGKTTTNFSILEDGKSMRLASEGFGELKMDVTARLAGNEIPFPASEMLNSIGGEAGAVSDFECTDDELKVRPRVDGKSSWQILKRMK